jgi:hypothetical protein
MLRPVGFPADNLDMFDFCSNDLQQVLKVPRQRYAEVILKRNAARVAALEAQEKGEKAAAKDAAPAPTPTPAAPVAAPVIPEKEATTMDVDEDDDGDIDLTAALAMSMGGDMDADEDEDAGGDALQAALMMSMGGDADEDDDEDEDGGGLQSALMGGMEEDDSGDEAGNLQKALKASFVDMDDADMAVDAEGEGEGAAESKPAATAPLKPAGIGLPLEFRGMYELFAVVTHKGRSSSSGHYIGWVRREGDNWLCFDDDAVAECKTEDVIRLKGGGDWHMQYLTFYRAKTVVPPELLD